MLNVIPVKTGIHLDTRLREYDKALLNQKIKII